MGTFAAGFFLDPGTGRPVAGQVVRVVRYADDIPLTTVTTGARGGYGRFVVAGEDAVSLLGPGGARVDLVSVEKILAATSGTTVAGQASTYALLPSPVGRAGQAWIVADEVAMYVSDGTVWGDPIPVQGEATAAAVSALTRTGKLPVGRDELVVRADDYVTGDGTTDDLAGLASIAATAATFGIPLALTRGATYRVNSTLDLPAGLILDAQGATIEGPASMNAAIVRVTTSDVTIRGHLRVRAGSGVANRGLTISGATNVHIDRVTVTAPNPGTGWGSNGLQTAVTISGSTDVTVGQATVTNYDYPVTIDGCTGVTIGRLAITSYVRGLYITNSTGVQVQGGRLRTASPNASVSPGHNGVLIAANTANDAVQDVTLSSLVVADAGEHGIRIAGDFRSSRIRLNHCTVTNAGSAGYKILGNAAVGSFNETIIFDHCIAEDCGILSTSCGWLIEKCVGVTLTAPVVRKKNQTYSAYTGIKMRGCTDVTITDPLIYDTATACIGFEPDQGNQTDVQIRGGKLSASMGHGILLDYTGVTYRRINILGFPVMNIGGTGFAFNAVSGGTGVLTGGPTLIQMTCPITSDRVVTGAYAGYMAEIHASNALPVSPPPLKNGSVWVDHSAGTRFMRKAGTWTQI